MAGELHMPDLVSFTLEYTHSSVETHESSQHPDCNLEDLNTRVDIERDVLDGVSYGLLETLLVLEHLCVREGASDEV